MVRRSIGRAACREAVEPGDPVVTFDPQRRMMPED
jgi:hypothetical protein